VARIATASTAAEVICLTDDSHLYPPIKFYQLGIELDLKVYIDSGKSCRVMFIKPIVQSVPFANSWQHLTNFTLPLKILRHV
jgi:molybdopterin-guanine dinucleotide biosynthesis protein A